MNYEYRVYVYLSGDQRMLLCTCDDPDNVTAVIHSLCSASRPGYARIEVEIAPPGNGG